MVGEVIYSMFSSEKRRSRGEMVSIKYLEGYHIQVGVNEINFILEVDMKQWVYIVRKHIIIGHQEKFPNIGCSTLV